MIDAAVIRSGSTLSPDDPVTVVLTDEVDPREHATPFRVGRYVPIDVVGRGGMGEVVRAYDPKLRREVALKSVCHGGLDDKGHAQLLREAQAMARLVHPNVVAVFDAETFDGDVVIVMEYVAGATLREWLAQPRGWREIVAAFVAAGRGLQAAHRVGIVHSDFKPSNVLLGEGPLGGEVFKVTDFGLARRFDDERSEPTIASRDAPVSQSHAPTMSGVVAGTPRYMSPEQHVGAAPAATSDQYAFCVALMEALVGRPPFAGKDIDELATAKLAGPPAAPRVPGMPRAIAAAIVRGLQPDPAQRWPELAALLGELERATRPRVRPLAATAIALALVGSVGALAWSSARGAPSCDDGTKRLSDVWNPDHAARIEAAMTATGASFAAESWARARAELDDYGARWIAGFDEACRATHVRGEESKALLDLRIACFERARSHLRATIDRLAQADRAVAENAIGTVRAVPALSLCSGDAGRLGAEILIPDDPQLAAEVAELREHIDEARVASRSGHDEDALASLQTIAVDVEATGFAPLIAEHASVSGRAENELAHYDEAERFYQRAFALSLAGGHHRLAAEAAINESALLGLARLRSAEGMIYAEVAIGLARAASNPDFEIDARFMRASIQSYQGQLAEAEAETRAVIELAERAPDYDDLRLLWYYPLLARVLYLRGAYAESEAEMRLIEQETIRIYGEGHPNTAFAWTGLSAVLFEEGELDEAEQFARKAIAGYEAAYGPRYDGLIQARDNLASVLQAAGRSAEAEVEYRAALALTIELHGPEIVTVGTIRTDLGEALESLGRDREAEAEYRAALALLEAKKGDGGPQLVNAKCGLGSLLRSRGRVADALPMLEACWLARKAPETPPPRTAVAAYELARALDELGGPPGRVAELIARAHAGCGSPGRFAARCREVAQWVP
jgi:eukaryotic-like serine/threonine-protein kinase